MIIRMLRLTILTALAAALALHVHAQAAVEPTCPATVLSLPYTDALQAPIGSMSSCWTAVVGPANSSGALIPAAGTASAVPAGYGVEMFTGVALAATPQSIQAAITWTGTAYPALTLDQDATGGAIAFEPSLNAIYSLAANSGNAPGGPLCTGTAPISSGDTFLLAKAGTTYTATDVTTGNVVCSVSSTLHSGVPGFQVDNRSGSSSIGPVTIAGQLAAAAASPAPPPTAAPSIQITQQAPPATGYIITLTNFNIPGATGNWAFTCAAPVAVPPAVQ